MVKTYLLHREKYPGPMTLFCSCLEDAYIRRQTEFVESTFCNDDGLLCVSHPVQLLQDVFRTFKKVQIL